MSWRKFGNWRYINCELSQLVEVSLGGIAPQDEDLIAWSFTWRDLINMCTVHQPCDNKEQAFELMEDFIKDQ